MTSESYGDTLRRLGAAQKGASRSAPAYSRFVNRRLGRYLAAGAYRAGMTPNQVTAVSAAFTFVGVAMLALVPPSWWMGLTVAVLFAVGYALDSADGQVARLSGTSSPAGEWLDHMVDATKVVAQPLALLIGLWRFGGVPDWWLLVPVLNAVIGSVLFFGMMLTEQLRRAHGVRQPAAGGGRVPWLRSLLVLPTDYGLLCWTFALLGATTVFAGVYLAITVLSGLMLLAGIRKWYGDIGRLGRPTG